MSYMTLLSKKSMATKEHLGTALKILLKNLEAMKGPDYEVFEVNRVGRSGILPRRRPTLPLCRY